MKPGAEDTETPSGAAPGYFSEDAETPSGAALETPSERKEEVASGGGKRMGTLEGLGRSTSLGRPHLKSLAKTEPGRPLSKRLCHLKSFAKSEPGKALSPSRSQTVIGTGFRQPQKRLCLL